MRRAARRVLGGYFDRATAAAVIDAAERALPEYCVRIPPTGAGARDLLRTSAHVLALHRALEPHLGWDRAADLVSDIVFASIMPARRALYLLSGLWTRDPIGRVRWGSRVAGRVYYSSPDWVMADVDIDEGFGIDITRCVVAEYFKALDAGELCERVICAQDARTAAAEGLRFERTETLASGGSRCDFRYLPLPTVRPGTLVDEVLIDASPEAVWAWLAGLADHYSEWHPDHVSAAWTSGPPNEVGSQLEAVEFLGGRRETLRFKMIEVTPPHRMSFRFVGGHALVAKGGRFEIEPCGSGSLFRARLDVRFGSVLERFSPSRARALRDHMREEGRAAKRLVEQRDPPSVISRGPGLVARP